jgi:tetrahydromethanopterin S-methyltransferase subunit G
MSLPETYSELSELDELIRKSGKLAGFENEVKAVVAETLKRYEAKIGRDKILAMYRAKIPHYSQVASEDCARYMQIDVEVELGLRTIEI